jgi:hypothetical protein
VTKPAIPILFFADDVLGIHPNDWQCRILLNYEAGHPVAAAAAKLPASNQAPAKSTSKLLVTISI